MFEGASYFLLVDLVIGKGGFESQTAIFEAISHVLGVFGFPLNYRVLYFAVIALFSMKVVIDFTVTVVDGHMAANLRRAIQDQGFSHVLKGDWETLRDIRVGSRLGAITEEAQHVALYFIGMIKASYSLLVFVVLVFMALLVSMEITLVFGLISLPIAVLLKHLFGRQATIAGMLVNERQGFYANITERLNVLFQIKVEDNTDYHIKRGIRNQTQLTRLEKKWWFIRGYIQSLNVSLPAFVLLIFYVWSRFKGQPLSDVLSLIAGVGIIGSRALNQINMLNANLGTITGYSGSIIPVYELFNIPRARIRVAIKEKIKGIKLNKVSYSYGEHPGIEGVSLDAGIGKPLVIMGPSGGGKTTIANLITGLMKPNSGVIEYIGFSGDKYNSTEYRAKIGYLTQDILLFHGTVRENLISSSDKVDDDVLWDCLKKVGAEKFVRELGGLDGMIAESGRSLSGGEKRRLGIARALTSDPDILILDEVTVGLDEAIKKDLITTIRMLSELLVAIVITHDMDLINSGDYDYFVFDEPSTDAKSDGKGLVTGMLQGP